MSIPIYHVDAFAEAPFSGNPAAVVLLECPADAAWMGKIAAELNLSETAFIVPRGTDKPGVYGLRWFTPRVEVDLCGHATLAAAHVLWEQRRESGEIIFETRSGDLRARRTGEWIELDFPADESKPIAPPAGLVEALGATPIHVRRGRDDLLIELDSAEAVRHIHPDFRQLAAFTDMRGVIVTAASDDDRYDFVSRFFAPAAGIDEDPATGSTHCTLGPYWAAKLYDDDLIGCQVSARRGVVRVRIAGHRVQLSGQAVTVLSGQLLST